MAAKRKNEKKAAETKLPVGRFINPFTDFGFKKIFGEEPNKDLLIDFLNELLSDHKQKIKNLTYSKNHRLGRNKLDRSVIFDLNCENENGEKFIVEMQKGKQAHFIDRALYYLSFLIQEQAIKGDWNYELKSVYLVGILDFKLDDKEKIIDRISLCDEETKEIAYEKLRLIFLQMEKFNLDIDQLQTRLDKWLYILRHMERMERIPESIKDKIFQRVFEIAEYTNLSKSEQSAYDRSLKYYRDLKNSLDTALMEGYQKAQKDYAKQLKNAHKREVIAQKREAEAQKEKAEAQQREAEAQLKLAKTIKRLHTTGMSISEIAEITGESNENIQQIIM